MKNRTVVAVVGLSGVGKSTLLTSVRTSVSFVHLRASSLIKDELDFQQQKAFTHDTLREAPIDNNQVLLIAAFRRLAPNSGLVVLDGHVMIDTPNGLVEIGPETFRALEVCHFVVLTARPEVIFQRRANDAGRRRPSRSVSELGGQQEKLLVTTQLLGEAIGAQVTELESSDFVGLTTLLVKHEN